MLFNRLYNGKELAWHLFKINLVSLGLSLIAMFTIDQNTSQFFAQNNLLNWQQLGKQYTDIGLSQHYFIFSFLFFAYFMWLAPQMKLWQSHPKKADFLKRWALNFFVVLITSGIWVQLLKMLIGRQRPHKTAPLYDPFVFVPFSWHWHWHSFPSGHSQTMFTVATMMTVAFPRAKWLWMAFAALICMTRVLVHDHFVSDTIFGACVGYTGTMVGLFLMKKYTKQGL